MDNAARLAQLVLLLGNTRTRSRRAQVVVNRRGVPKSSELRRIEQLPRRVWGDDEVEEAVEVLTETLRTPRGTMRLWPLQAQSIAEIVDNRGALLPVPAGDGKALISLLAPSLMPECARPVLFVPAHLREQTRRVVIPSMRKHWRIRDDIRVIGYSELSLAKNAEMLDEINPEFIAADECHYLKHLKSGRTKRMRRFMRANEHCVFAGMSGTITQRSLHDYAHILGWTHGAAKAPIPMRYTDLCDWASALDERVQEGQRMEAGALTVLCREEETVADGFRRRLVETPGFVFGDSTHVTSTLTLRKLDWPAPPLAKPMLERLRDSWEDPNGDPVMEAIVLWQKARQLALGFWLRWVPPAPRDWLDSRRAWAGFVRDTLGNNQRGLDTPLQVYRECATTHHEPRLNLLTVDDETPVDEQARKMAENFRRREEHTKEHAKWKAGLNPQHCDWCMWQSVKDDFKPNPVAEWIDYTQAQLCADWAVKEKGIVWVDNPVFGEKVAEFAGCQYFGAGDERILTCPAGPIVASLRAHGTGRNLQDRWHKMLFASPPSSNDATEQGLARCHRAGQPHDEVEAFFVLGEDEQMLSMQKAVSQARYVKSTIGTRQRLLYANYDFELPGEE